MRTTERLDKLEAWLQKELCEGRRMKAPAPDLDVAKVIHKEPSVFIGYAPRRADATGFTEADPFSTAPSITVMPVPGLVKYVEEQRFDRFKNVHRTQNMGQQLNVQMLFAVYEDGVRLPGFAESAEKGEMDLSLIMEGTREGLYTLLNWMDDCKSALLGVKCIPGTDMYVDIPTLTYGLYSDQNYMADKRPLFYGLMEARFICHADESLNPDVEELL